jgi:hypothetical protein
MVTSLSTPDAMMKLSNHAKIKYRRLLPVLIAATPIAIARNVSHRPSRVNDNLRGGRSRRSTRRSTDVTSEPVLAPRSR